METTNTKDPRLDLVIQQQQIQIARLDNQIKAQRNQLLELEHALQRALQSTPRRVL
jgi:uncharacterized protein (DUF3084 family)